MNKKNKLKIIIILILIISLFFTYGISFAKYTYNSILNYYYKSKEFYFYSDYLDVSEVSNVNNNWDGKKTYFNVKNYLNNNLITEYDIKYQASCTTNNTNYECIINNDKSTYDGVISSSNICVDNDKNIINIDNMNECISNNYEWVNSKSTMNLSFDVLSLDNSEINDVVVNIIVTSIKPYKKILKGKYILSKSSNINNDLSLTSKDMGDYVEVVVSNLLNDKKNYTFSFDSNYLRVDMNDKFKINQSDSNGFINKINFDLESKNNIKIILYKIDLSKKYDNNDFDIMINN